ncbi:MAG: sensor histidine kinase, partial [Chitinophagales bacterium]
MKLAAPLKHFILLMVVFQSAFCYSQNYGFKHYTVDDGLPSQFVFCTEQDKDGFIWFGTDIGLCRYDGFEFVNFTSSDGLPDNEVFELWPDSKGRIWISCYNSSIAYYENGIIYNSSNSALLKDIPKSIAYRTFYEDKQGDIWIGGIYSVVKITDSTAEQLIIEDYRGRALIDFYTIGQDFYLLDATRVYHWEDNNFKLVREENYGKKLANFNRIILLDSFGIMFNRSAEVVKLNYDPQRNVKSYHIVPLGFNVVKILISPVSKELIVASDDGVIFTDSSMTSIHSTALSNNVISNLKMDMDGNIWFTSFGSGVFMLPHNRPNIINYNNAPIYDVVYSVKGDKENNIIAATESGFVYKIKNNEAQIKLPAFKTGIGERKVIDIIERNDHYLLGAGAGIIKWYKETNEFEYYRIPGAIKTISANSNNIFASGTGTSYYIDKDLKTFDTILDIRILASCFDKNDLLYLATGDYLLSYMNKKIDTVKWYDFEKYGRISDIEFLSDNTIIIATYNHGVIIKTKHSLQFISNKEGLSADLCRKIFIDEHEQIWVCTSKGLNKIIFNKENEKLSSIYVYEQTDGLQSNSVYSVFVRNDTVWVGTDVGLSWFDSGIDSNKIFIPVYITSISVNNNVYKDPYTLPQFKYFQNQVAIDFTGISFINSGNITYAYRLAGIDQVWSFTKQRAVQYSKLKPGDYIFEVYAFDSKGNRSKITASLQFSIQPAFWQTVWFKILIAIFILIVIVLIVLLWIKNIRTKASERSRVDKQLSEIKLESIRSQLNPHFIFNALNSVQNFNIKNDTRQAQKYLSDFSKLMRKTLDHAKKDFIPLEEEIEYLNNYLALEKLRYREQFEFIIEVDPKINIAELLIPTQIIQPYAENAIHHGLKYLEYGHGQLTIIFSVEKKHLICTIEDNGIGII